MPSRLRQPAKFSRSGRNSDHEEGEARTDCVREQSDRKAAQEHGATGKGCEEIAWLSGT